MKILINLCTTDLPEDAFNELSKPFEEYKKFNFQFPVSEYYLDIIDTILTYLSKEEGIKPYNSKIVLQSNISNLMIAWYRLYNDVIDEFILINQQLISFKSNDENETDFVLHLSNLSSIETESCHGRFYYRNHKPMAPVVLKPFMESYQYDLLKPFSELDIQKENKKKKIEKGYRLNGHSYIRATANETVDMIIDLNNRREFQNNIQINEIKQPSGYFFTFQYILSLQIQDFQKAQAATALNQQMCEEDKLKVTQYVNDYLAYAQSELSFKEVINYYSFLVMLDTDETVVEQMLTYIKKDEKHMLDHYAPYTNTLFYISRANQKEYRDYFLDRVEIMSKLKAFYKPKLKIKAQRSSNHLVIVTGQLLNYNHAPTKVVIDYANNLLKYYPKLIIKIVVEDMFNYSPNELFFVYPFSSADSKILSEEHGKLLDPSIEVHYSYCRLSRKKRLQEDIKAITDFKPQWILKYAAPDSLVVDQLYDYYPVASMSAGGAEYSEFVHMSSGGRAKMEVIAERESKGISNDDYRYEQHIPGLELPQSTGKYKREQFGMNDNDFIVVTVGNRLDAEINETFGNGMKMLLEKYKNIKWLIIGIEYHEIINAIFGKTLNQVKYLSYVKDLIDIYDICDVYANPFRQGGGISVAMAMDAGLPVVNLIGQNDANMYIPNGKAKSEENYFIYIEKLFNDREYIQSEGMLFQSDFRGKFGFEQATSHIMKLLQRSEYYYKQNKN